MAETGQNEQRLNIPYFEGVNSTVQHVISKITELFHVENAREKIIGSIEKREGQQKVGTNVNGNPFYAQENYGLFYFPNNGGNTGIFRITDAPAQDLSTLVISVVENTSVYDVVFIGGFTPKVVQLKVVDYVTTGEPTFFIRADTFTLTIDGTSSPAAIYSLNSANQWSELGSPEAQNMIGATYDTALYDANVAIVNGRDYNRQLNSDGATVIDSTGNGNTLTTSDFFNSPRAGKVSYYKNQIYLGDITLEGQRFPTTVMRSSYQLGIAALVSGDVVMNPSDPTQNPITIDYVSGPGWLTFTNNGDGTYKLTGTAPGSPTGDDTVEFTATDTILNTTMVYKFSFVYPTASYYPTGTPYANDLNSTLTWAVGADRATSGDYIEFTNTDGYNMNVSFDAVNTDPIILDNITLSQPTTTNPTQAFFHGALPLNTPNTPLKVTINAKALGGAQLVGHATFWIQPTDASNSFPAVTGGIPLFATPGHSYSASFVTVQGTYNNVPVVIGVTDTSFFYSDTTQSGVMNYYDVYRGINKIASFYVSKVNNTSIWAPYSWVTLYDPSGQIESADEIWVGNTFTGYAADGSVKPKQYRWVQGPSSIARDVKQYNTFKLAGGTEDPITMMDSVGNVMFVGNKNTLMTWNGYMLENFDLGIGCVAKQGHVKYLGSLYFVHYTGIYSTTGGVPVLLSRKIQSYIYGATKSGLENAVAGYKGLSVFFAIGDVTLYNNDGSFWKVLNDVCLEYNLADQNWYVHTNVPAAAFVNWFDSIGTEHLYMNQANDKYVKEFLIGNTDDGETIFFRVDTQVLQLMKKPELYGQPVAVISEIDRGSMVECFVSIDDGDYFPVKGTFRKGISFLKITAMNGDIEQPVPTRKLRVSFRDASPQLCKLIQCSVAYVPTNIMAPSEDSN